jgi:hypothetical protein
MASDARVEGLAVSEGFLEDYVNMSSFPTVAARYANLVVVSLGPDDDDDKSVGVVGSGDNSNYGVFALFLNQNDDDGMAELDLTWAKQFSSATFGVSLLWNKSSTETGSAKTTPSGGGFNTLALTGGVKFDMNNNSMLELAAQIGWLSYETTDGTGTVIAQDNGNASYRVSGRIMKEVSSRSTLVPLLSYSKTDMTADPLGGTEEDDTMTELTLGVALHYEVNGNDLLILGVSGDYDKTEDVGAGVDESSWHLPTLFAALEFDVYSWLTVRAGASKSFERTDDTPTDTQTLSSDYDFGLGMGIHFDHFDVDAVVDTDAVFTGGYLFSGSSSDPLTRITATYYF